MECVCRLRGNTGCIPRPINIRGTIAETLSVGRDEGGALNFLTVDHTGKKRTRS